MRAWFAMLLVMLLASPVAALACDPPGPGDPQLRLRLSASDLVGYGTPPLFKLTLTNLGDAPLTFTTTLGPCGQDVRVDVVEDVSGRSLPPSACSPTVAAAAVTLAPGAETHTNPSAYLAALPIPGSYTARASWQVHLGDRCIVETSNALGFRLAPDDHSRSY